MNVWFGVGVLVGCAAPPAPAPAGGVTPDQYGGVGTVANGTHPRHPCTYTCPPFLPIAARTLGTPQVLLSGGALADAMLRGHALTTVRKVRHLLDGKLGLQC